MAELFVARAEDAQWPVVLKTVHPSRAKDRDVVSLFMNEARLVSQVSHPNVARITDVGFDRNRPFIAMEYFASRTLADVMLALARRKLPMPAELAAYVTCEAAAGLDAAHGLRDVDGRPLHLVHRDVTAKNLLVGYGGGVKVIDFGIARADGVEPQTTPGHVRGTAAWVSPEQARGGPVTPGTDVWALGVNLYLMLAGQLPFSGKSDVELLNKVIQSEPVGVRRLRADVPESLAEVLPRALAKSPVERYPSMADLREELLALVPDLDACRSSLAALMDSLFPPDTDEERLRVAKLAPEEVMPADATSPLKRLMGWLRR
jgi:serine/threonine-protein kinase